MKLSQITDPSLRINRYSRGESSAEILTFPETFLPLPLFIRVDKFEAGMTEQLVGFIPEQLCHAGI